MDIGIIILALGCLALGFVIGRKVGSSGSKQFSRLEAESSRPVRTQITTGAAVQIAAALPAKDLDEITMLIRRGRLLEAIKHYRSVTGQGLKESKDAIELLKKDVM